MLCYDPCMKRSYYCKSPHQFVLKPYVKKFFFLHSQNFKNDFCLRLRKFHTIVPLCMFLFIYLLFKVFTQSSLHHNHIDFFWQLFFSVEQIKTTSKKDPYQLSLPSKIDDILEYWLYFDLKRGNFAIFTGRKCFWSVRCSDVSEFYCNFICLRQVSPRMKENESHLLTAAWK